LFLNILFFIYEQKSAMLSIFDRELKELVAQFQTSQTIKLISSRPL